MGDPIYLRLTRFVDFRFDYHFAAEQPHAIQGTTRLVAQVSDVNGWQRTIVLQEARPFAGDGTSLMGELDLNVISSYLQNLEDQTGVSRPFYTLAILPEIRVQGDLSGNLLEGSFAPQLKFMIDKFQLQILPPDPDTPDADPLRPRSDDAVQTSSVLPNRLSMLGASMLVSSARRVAGLGLLIGLGGLALLGLWFYREQKTNPAAMVQLKFGAQMAEVQVGSFESELGSQEVVSIDDLARIAEKSGQMIYWVGSEAGRDYFVQDGRLVYHYWLPLAPKTDGGEQLSSDGPGESGKGAG